MEVGFGALDEVMDGLRDDGRGVGVGSHVAELRQRMPVQIHACKSHPGSHLTMTSG